MVGVAGRGGRGRLLADKLDDMTVSADSMEAFIPGDIAEMCSSAMDAWLDDPAVLTDEQWLLTIMHEACHAGGATVVGQTSAVFPNGAVTAVLLLAESHLSVHTWPEHGFARFDLLTCGQLDARLILDRLRQSLQPTRVNITRFIRDI